MHYRYRGYTICKFDGYYDVHKGAPKFYPQPIAECFASAKEAKAFIDQWKRDEQFERLLEGKLRSVFK